MNRNRRSPIAAAALSALLLTACESPPFLSQLMPSLPSLPGLRSLPDFGIWDEQTCASVDADDVKRVNWTRVPEINMRIRSGEFEPMIVQMKQGWPYVFRIRNGDDEDHTFTSRDFFSSMTMIRITIDGDRQNRTCVPKIRIPAKKTVEMRLVAAVDGRFEFEDTPVPIKGLFLSKGASGVIIVEESFATRYR